MKIQFDRSIDVDGKKANLHWSSEKRANDLRNASSQFGNRLSEIETEYGLDEYGDAESKLSEEDLKQFNKDLRTANAEFYRTAFGIMLDFEDGLPDVDWFMRPEFPSGMLHPLRQVFINPQVEM